MPRDNTLFFSVRRALQYALGLLVLVANASGAAVAFDLPAQPAPEALVAFAKQAGVDVLFSSSDLKDIRSNEVTGTLEPEKALEILLRNTGFVAELAAPGKFVVRRVRKGATQIRGTALDGATGSPLAGAWVRLPGTTLGARTRSDGTFLVSRVPQETRSLVIQSAGYAPTVVSDVRVVPGSALDIGTIRLTAVPDGPAQLDKTVVSAGEMGGLGPPVVSLDSYVVTPSRFKLDEEPGMQAATLSGRDLQALPQLGDDLYRAISHLPGIATDDATVRFWVRGAPHEEVLARLDGVELIEPFHLQDTRSSLSILDVETIGRLDLYTGGFTAEFGDRLAGVLSMETASHVNAKPHHTIGLSLTGARLASRGQAKGGKVRWLTSARAGYPDLALEASVDDDGEIKPEYHDMMGKLELDVAPGHTVSFHALHSGDRMYFRDSAGPVLTSSYSSDYLWTRWRGEFGIVRGETLLSWTRGSWQRDASGIRDRYFGLGLADRRTLRTVALRQDWSALVRECLLLRGGLELKDGEADYRFSSFHDAAVSGPFGYQIRRFTRDNETSPSGLSGGAYIASRARPTKSLTIEPGLRYDANDYADDHDVSPRLNAAYDLGRTTFRAAWGRYHQMQGLHRLAASDGEMDFRRSERAEHRVASVEHRLMGGVSMRIEGYERVVSRPQPRWENVIDRFDAVPELARDRIRLDPVHARSRGLEMIVEKRGDGKLTWSASYALARANETLPNGREVPRVRDQRHTAALDVTYSPNRAWQLSAAFQYHTGWPVTDRSYSLMQNGNGWILVANEPVPYAGRLPSYQRLDLRAQRTFHLRSSTLRVYVDVFNALNRENTINYGYTVNVSSNGTVTTVRRRGDRLLPLLPSIGLVWDF